MHKKLVEFGRVVFELGLLVCQLTDKRTET